MPRSARLAPGGIIHHVLNRGVGKTRLFRSDKDYQAFQSCLNHALVAAPCRLLGYCVMPNHWHLLLWPQEDGELAQFMMRLTNTHVRRWLTAHNQVGSGHLYQGRYKSFAVQDDEHFLTVARYIERNPVRAGGVNRAESWPWSSAGQSALPAALQVPLARWPMRHPADWKRRLNHPQPAAEEAALGRCIKESRPYGSPTWLKRTMNSLGWSEPAKPGRPRKER